MAAAAAPRRPPFGQRLTSGALGSDYLMHGALLALERWERLTPSEQYRFRVLVRSARGNAKANLPNAEYRELRTIWKKLEHRHLIAETFRAVPRMRRSSAYGD
jgi:hypothetical protein